MRSKRCSFFYAWRLRGALLVAGLMLLSLAALLAFSSKLSYLSPSCAWGQDWVTPLSLQHRARTQALLQELGERPTPDWAHALFVQLARSASSEGPPFRWTLHTYQDSRLAAQAGLEGQILVSSGTWDKLRNRQGLAAAVLAHEIAHVSKRHALVLNCRAKPLMQQLMAGTSQSSFEEVNAELSQLAHAHEFEADEVGQRLLARAGQDPRDLLRVLNALEAPGQDWAHPSAQARQDRLKWLSPYREPPSR